MGTTLRVPLTSKEKPTLAVVSHDGPEGQLKQAMVELLRPYISILRRFFNLIATDGTGRAISKQLGLEVEFVKHGPDGGDKEISRRIRRGEVAGLFFLIDPSFHTLVHLWDIIELMDTAITHGIPCAFNLASCRRLLHSLITEVIESKAVRV